MDARIGTTLAPDRRDVDYRAVFTALSAPKLVLSPDLVVLDANDAYLASRRRTRASIVGRHLADTDPQQRERAPESVARVVSALQRARRTGRYEIVEPHRLDVPGPDGTMRERYVLVTVMPVVAATMEVEALILRLEDVTGMLSPAHAGAGTDDVLAIRASLARMRRDVARERVAARRLQDSVLTAPPATPGLVLDVRYRPASTETRLGGDWYDVITLPDGRTVLVVGDVTGHDVDAAATMAHLRGVLRTVAYDSAGSPAQVLDRAERVAAGLGIDAFAAVGVVALDPPADDGSRRLVCARAGSLPPLLRRADRSAELFDAPPGALFGLRLPGPRPEAVTHLCPGGTLLMFTDGLVERRDESCCTSLERLRDDVAAMVDVPPEVLCDAVLGAGDGGGDDDVALVAARVLPAPGDIVAP
ncbi:PP2C family protein-serine/threonine phosphatase [Sediminihabitans luteus]|uniref:PP2C family protein-serine/threonine phosphatase n=1 Tax=Sediminihabitans luteus TaxID=1138585 RepID=UPI00147658CB|nr:SpoIIE family protein phosphatase [Sediminihabitans luteus]